MTSTAYPALVEEWTELLSRRSAFRETLAPYTQVLEAWCGRASPGMAPLRWSAAECRDAWGRGVPLLAVSGPSLSPAEVEPLLDVAVGVLAAIGDEQAALARFVEAWDRGSLPPSALFPERGRVGTVAAQRATGLSQDSLAFLACASLRPDLDAYFSESRPHLADDAWDLGVCPFCGAPPGFGDLTEHGHRRLACHLCGAGWTFARMRCPLCGHHVASDLVRLEPEEAEEGYLVSACKRCHGYLKELDRRIRWNGASALVEDWGSPHFDLVASRRGYWRPLPSLITLARRC
jgi:FdhE protein